jgi:hypothetical protein
MYGKQIAWAMIANPHPEPPVLKERSHIII